uniref:Ig-like domain-containing protein n=1 Tax=Strigops habroptila TaxID=2489341 RepID=A0A672TI36_STRHB
MSDAGKWRGCCWSPAEGARITQTSSLVLKEDDKATLTCSQNDNHPSMYWYLQQPGKGLQLIYYSIGVNQQFEGDFHIGYKAQRPNLSDFSLDIFSVKMNYSAVYFCASSLNTALQSHFLSLHKLLSFSVLSLRREPLSAQEEGM